VTCTGPTVRRTALQSRIALRSIRATDVTAADNGADKEAARVASQLRSPASGVKARYAALVARAPRW